jgi:nicotinate-nucleotide adenylyltransferase
MARVGVLGGSFNPVHVGHLHMALLAREEAGLDRVIFVPARRPPHKTDAELAPPSERLAMLRAALVGEERAEVSTLEMEEGGPLYTYETLRRLRNTLPGEEIRFVMGLDSLLELPGWRDPERIVEEFGVIVVDRPGCPLPPPEDPWLARCRLVEGNPFAVSSSLIRERVADGRSIHHLVPPPVEAHIRAQGLYRVRGG